MARPASNVPAGGQLPGDPSAGEGSPISNATVPQLAGAAPAINWLFAAGALAARIGKALPLAQGAEAQRLVESGQSHAQRIVLAVG